MSDKAVIKKQELVAFREHLSSPPVLSGSVLLIFLAICVVLCYCLYEYIVESLLGFNTTGRESDDLVVLTAKNCCFEVFSCFRLHYVVF